MAIQLFKPKYDVEECLEGIRECLEKGWTGLGFKTVEFEEAWKKYTGLPYAYYINSNTVGLNLAFDILKEHFGWEDGDEVITTPITFISTNHAIRLNGLKAVFADIDDTFCLDPASVVERISDRTRAVIFVGLGGNTGRLREIEDICKKQGIKLILDAAHMAGTRLDGRCPGENADVTVFSFQAVKNLPTADSGMICFNDGELDAIARKKGWLGINKDTYTRSSGGASYKWKYDVEYTGYKYHGNSVMAAIGLAQLPHLDDDNARRREIASMYRAAFDRHSDVFGMAYVPDECLNSQHLFQIVVEDRDGLLMHLNENEIYPGVHYIDNTEYRMYSYAHGTCPRAEYLSNHTLSLPLHLNLTDEDVQRVIDAVLEYCVG